MASSASHSLVFRFGPFELDPAKGELHKSGIALKVHPQPFSVLLLLIERAGQIVTRHEIQRSLWGDNTFVDFDRGINFCINQIRIALADNAANPRYIETVPRRGYRFIAPIDTVQPADVHIAKQPIALPVTRPLQANENPASAVYGPRADAVIPFARSAMPRRWRRWVIGLASAALLVATALAVAFAWHKWRGGHSQSRLAEQQLTSNAPEEHVMSSAISPDGKYLAYADQSGLFARSLDTHEIRPVFLPADFPPSEVISIIWFPDGGKLLLTRWTSEGFSLWVVPVLGQAPPHLFRKDAAGAAISPDGKSIAFLSGSSPSQLEDLWVSGINSEAPHKIAAAVPVDFPSPVSWSPDSKWIAYFDWSSTKSGTGGFIIEARPASGGTSTLLASNTGLAKPLILGPYALDWIPDGRLIFEVIDSSALPQQHRYSLWEAPVTSGRPRPSGPSRQLTPLRDLFYESLTATSNGKEFAGLETRIHQDVYLAELHDGKLKAPHRFTLDNRDSFPEVWTHDSQSILFVSNRNGKDELFQQALKDAVPQRMESSATNNIGYGNGLTPDGKWLLFWQIPPRSSVTQPQLPIRLMRQHIGGGSVEQVLEMPYLYGENANLRCPLNPRGHCVLQMLSGKNAENALFYTLDPIQGRGDFLGSIRIPNPNPVAWSLSPDGSEIAAVGHKDRIDILDLSDRAWHAINVQPGWGDFQSLAWDANGKGFFLTTVLPQSFNLLHVSLNGHVQPLLHNAQKQWLYKPLPSPDGRYLAFQAQTWDSNVWLLKNF